MCHSRWALQVALILTPLAAGQTPLTVLGDTDRPQDAAAVRKALGQVVEDVSDWGNIVLLYPEAPANVNLPSLPQAERGAQSVTVVDTRGGAVQLRVPPLGRAFPGCATGFGIERELKLGQGNAGHWGVSAASAIENRILGGSSSYAARLIRPAQSGRAQRLYIETIAGIYIGQFLNVGGTARNFATPPTDRITVQAYGWDAKERAYFIVADLKHDHPAGTIVQNKNNLSGLMLRTLSNAPNQTMDLHAVRHHYAQGDCFVMSGMLKYMGNVMSGLGDEGGVVVNAETTAEIDSFHSRVEAIDWSTGVLRYAPGKVNAHTLAVGRPLINMNSRKWITSGHVAVVARNTRFEGVAYRDQRDEDGLTIIGGAIIGSADCGWNEDVVGRFFALTEETEIISPDDTSQVGGYSTNPERPVLRWYEITEYERLADGRPRIQILRTLWRTGSAGAPHLFREDNYSLGDKLVPLRYAIAPGAWVSDVTDGWADTIHRAGRVDSAAPREIRLAPTPVARTAFDFEPGDEIEQAIGPDPYHPRPLRIRQSDQLPAVMPSASVQIRQLGRVQVDAGVTLEGPIRSAAQLDRRKDRKPPYKRLLDLAVLADVGIDFDADVTDAAIVFRQRNKRVQPIRWQTWVAGDPHSNYLQVNPSTADFEFINGDLHLTDRGLKRTSGISATNRPAKNLRGIDVSVPPGAREVEVAFAAGQQEADGRYAIAVTPSWLTTVAVTEKTSRGFRVRFGEAAPGGASVDWLLLR